MKTQNYYLCCPKCQFKTIIDPKVLVWFERLFRRLFVSTSGFACMRCEHKPLKSAIVLENLEIVSVK